MAGSVKPVYRKQMGAIDIKEQYFTGSGAADQDIVLAHIPFLPLLRVEKWDATNLVWIPMNRDSSDDDVFFTTSGTLDAENMTISFKTAISSGVEDNIHVVYEVKKLSVNTEMQINISDTVFNVNASYSDSGDVTKKGLVDGDRHVQEDVITTPMEAALKSTGSNPDADELITRVTNASGVEINPLKEDGIIVPIKSDTGWISDHTFALTKALKTVDTDELISRIVNTGGTEINPATEETAGFISDNTFALSGALKTKDTDELISRIVKTDGNEINPATEEKQDEIATDTSWISDNTFALTKALKTVDEDEFISRITNNSGVEINPATEETLATISDYAVYISDYLFDIKTAVEIMDDWDESNRAKVNINLNSGVAVDIGEGAVGSGTPRVTIATDDANMNNISDNTFDIKNSIEVIDDTVYTKGSGTPSKGVLVMGDDGTNPQALKVNADGELEVNWGTDIQIGAVELKDGDSDTRADIESDGTKNALFVQANDLDVRDTEVSDSVFKLSQALKSNDADEFITRITDNSGSEINPATEETVEAISDSVGHISDNTFDIKTAIEKIDDWEGTGTHANHVKAVLYATDTSGNPVNVMADDEGHLQVDLVAGDIEIGAVELKNGTDDTRAHIESDGIKNALYIQANDLDVRDLTSASDSVEVLQDTAGDLNCTEASASNILADTGHISDNSFALTKALKSVDSDEFISRIVDSAGAEINPSKEDGNLADIATDTGFISDNTLAIKTAVEKIDDWEGTGALADHVKAVLFATDTAGNPVEVRADDDGDLQVDIASSIPAGTNNIGKVTVDDKTSLSKTAVDVGDCNDASQHDATGVDVLKYQEKTIYVDVTVGGGDPSAQTVKVWIEISPDNAVWYRLGSKTDFTGAGAKKDIMSFTTHCSYARLSAQDAGGNVTDYWAVAGDIEAKT